MLLEIVQGVLNEGVSEVLVVSLQEGPLRQRFEALGCKVSIVPEPMPLFRGGKPGEAALSWVVMQLGAAQTDVVMANTILGWWAVEAAAAIRLPSLWVIHESEAPLSHLSEHGKSCVARGRWALSATYRTIFVSGATREVFQSLECRSNFHTIYNGFDKEAYEQRIAGKSRRVIREHLGLADDQLMVLVPGTVCPRKSQIDVIRAMALVADDVLSRVTLFLVGDRPGSYSDELHQQIAQLSPERQASIKVLPHCEHIEDYFLAADIMASAARARPSRESYRKACISGSPCW